MDRDTEAPDRTLARDVEAVRSVLGSLDADLVPLSVLGQSPMAVVLQARDKTLPRLVAVKVLSAEMTKSSRARARFMREAESAAKLSHRNIIQILRVGETDRGVPYLVMPFIEGTTLEDRIAAVGPFSALEAARTLLAVGSALASAHAAGIVHRDVKASNVLRDERTGNVVLMDFGVAGVLESGEGTIERLTKTGEILGYPEYATTEYTPGQRITDRTDIYGLGLLALTLINGHPVPGNDRVKIERELALARGRAPELVEHVERWLAAKPERRPTAEDVCRRLHEAMQPSPKGRLYSKLQKRRIPEVVAGSAAVGWVSLEVVDQLVNQDLLGALSYRVTLSTVIATVAAVWVAAWFHGEKGPQEIRRSEVAILALIAAGWLTAVTLLIVLDMRS